MSCCVLRAAGTKVLCAAALVALHGVAVAVFWVAFSPKADSSGELCSALAFATLRLAFVEGECVGVVLCGE